MDCCVNLQSAIVPQFSAARGRKPEIQTEALSDLLPGSGRHTPAAFVAGCRAAAIFMDSGQADDTLRACAASATGQQGPPDAAPGAVADVLFPELVGHPGDAAGAGNPAGAAARQAAAALAERDAGSDRPGCTADAATAEAVLAEQGWEERGVAATRRGGAPRVGGGAGRRRLVARRWRAEHCRRATDTPSSPWRSRRCRWPPNRPAAVLAAMLAAALAEHPPERVIVWHRRRSPAACGRTSPRPRRAARRSSKARSTRGGARPCRPGVQRRRRARLSGVLAGVAVTAFAPAFYTGWGVTDDAAGVPPRPFRAGCRRDLRRRLPGRDPLSRPVPRRRIEFEEALAIARRLAAARRSQPADRGVRRHVVLETPADRRFRALVGRRPGVPPHRRRRARGRPRIRGDGAAGDRRLGLAPARRAWRRRRPGTASR